MGPAEVAQRAWRGGDLSPAQLKELLRAGAVHLLDVRNAPEVQAWPLPGALHIPMDELAERGPREVPVDLPSVVVCAHGERSARAAAALAGMGYPAASLRGGMAAWAATYDAATVPVGDGHLTQVRRLGKGCLSYVLEADGEAAVVDPTCHLEATLEVLRRRGLAARHVVDTHRHADHLSGAVELARATGARLHLSDADGYGPGLPEPAELRGGAVLAVGERRALTLEAVPTPGHTPGSLSLLVDEAAVLTGDALFLDGFARPDLRDNAEAHARALFQTYRRIAEWPAGLDVYPAHLSGAWPLRIGEVATRPLGEVRHALHLFHLEEPAFVARVLRHLPPRPPNYQEILEANRRGARCDPEVVDRLEAGGNQCVAT